MSASEKLSGKTAVVVGASSGINLGVARHLGALGARVAILSRTKEKIEHAADGLKEGGIEAIGLAADVRNAEQLQTAFERVRSQFGSFDILVSGAAGNFFADAKNISPNGFKTVVDIDLIGTFNVLRMGFEHMTRPGGSMINITAPQAKRAMPKQAHVCAAKAGIDMLTKCLALEWGAEGIRVNAVSPGPIEDTEGFARLATNADLRQRIEGALALPRLGQRVDIGRAVEWISSDQASFVTGTILDCDGGMVLGNLYSPD